MKILNDHRGEINGDVRFDSFQELDIIVIALNELAKKDTGTLYSKYSEKIATNLSSRLIIVADKLADIHNAKTYVNSCEDKY